MFKFRMYFDKDEEVNWLNRMSEEGWTLTGFFAGFYNFEKRKDERWLYQLDMGDKMFAVSDEYRELMEEMGVEIVQTWGYWIILRKPASEGKFELYTDIDSSIEHYTKIYNMFKGAAMIILVCFMIEVIAMLTETGMVGLIFTIIVGIPMIAMFGAVKKTKNVIDKLKEKK